MGIKVESADAVSAEIKPDIIQVFEPGGDLVGHRGYRAAPGSATAVTMVSGGVTSAFVIMISTGREALSFPDPSRAYARILTFGF